MITNRQYQPAGNCSVHHSMYHIWFLLSFLAVTSYCLAEETASNTNQANTAPSAPTVTLEESLAGTNPYRRIFLDATVVESSNSLNRIFHQPAKHPANLLIKREHDWEGWGPYLYGTVLKDDGKFKIWYSCIGDGSGFTCYAESQDGLNWDKPKLGIYDRDGSKANNIIGKIVESAVIQKPQSNASAPWTLFCWAGSKGAFTASSTDGLNWQWQNGREKIFSTSDVVNFFYDPYYNRYVSTYKTPSRRHRAVGIAFSNDGLTWTKPIPSPVFTADDLDPDPTQVYGMPVFPYQGFYIGTPWIYHARFFKYGQYSPDRMNEAQTDSPRTVDVQFAWSWDLINWTRTPNRKPFIPLGQPDTWDDGMIFTARAPVIVGDSLYFYYGAFDRVHDDYKGIKAAIGLATLRLDGFCSIHAGEEEGWLISRREVFNVPSVHINAKTVSNGYVVAELLDRNNNVLEGFSQNQCIAFHGDSTHHLLIWTTTSFSQKQAASDKKIRFYIKNADLYSYLPVGINTQLDQGNREAR